MLTRDRWVECTGEWEYQLLSGRYRDGTRVAYCIADVRITTRGGTWYWRVWDVNCV
jgi:hypothetical protein